MRPLTLISAVALAAGVSGYACIARQPATDTGDPGFPLGPTSATAQPIAYTQDLQQFFFTDCAISCHNARDARGNYSMSTYADVMKDVRAGDASCKLVVDSEPGGSMYQYFSGDRQAKAAEVFRWVVVYGAGEHR